MYFGMPSHHVQTIHDSDNMLSQHVQGATLTRLSRRLPLRTRPA